MTAVIFSPIEIGRGLSLIFDLFTLGFFILIAIYFLWKIFFGGISSNEKMSEKQLLKLSREWCENGTAITNWLRIHLVPGLSLEVVISKPEFQELLRKDFEIYDKLVILDPTLKEDPIVNKGRDFYKSLVRTEN